MKVKKSAKKSDNRIVYIAVGTVAVIAAILFLSSGNSPTGDGVEATTSTIPPSTAPETLSGNLRIENIEVDKLKMFNGEDVVIKSSVISFFINDAAIRCSGVKDLEPRKVMECTLEARCQKGDVLKITYSGKSIEHRC